MWLHCCCFLTAARHSTQMMTSPGPTTIKPTCINFKQKSCKTSLPEASLKIWLEILKFCRVCSCALCKITGFVNTGKIVALRATHPLRYSGIYSLQDLWINWILQWPILKWSRVAGKPDDCRVSSYKVVKCWAPIWWLFYLFVAVLYAMLCSSCYLGPCAIWGIVSLWKSS